MQEWINRVALIGGIELLIIFLLLIKQKCEVIAEKSWFLA